MEDVIRSMKLLISVTKDIVLMQCNTNYTSKIENFKYINLNVLKTFHTFFPDVILGLSDHTLGHATVLGAVALGASVFEKHFTDDNNREGPDHKFAMNPKTWREMVNRANELYEALGDGIKKVEDNEKETAIVQRRALYFSKDMKKGQIIEYGDLFPLRPRSEDGIPPHEIQSIVGTRLLHDVNAGHYIKREDFE
jgi:N-acetylneuraminate synthase